MVKAFYVGVDIGRAVQLFNMRLHGPLGAARWLYKLIDIASEGYGLTIPRSNGVFNSRFFPTINIPGQQMPSIL